MVHVNLGLTEKSHPVDDRPVWVALTTSIYHGILTSTKTSEVQPPTAALDLQKFGVDQRRLLKHSGTNNLRPVPFRRRTTRCCSLSRSVSHIDDPASSPQVR